MELSNVILEQKDAIVTVTIHRPEKLNALNETVVGELLDAFLELRDNPDVRAVVLTGSGEKSFVAGADITELAVLDPVKGKVTSERGQLVFSLIEDLGKPVIAAVNGWALGGGLELALACTVRVASEKAKFGLPEVTLGIIPGYGGTQRLPRVIGRGLAFEMILSGDPVDAQEAYRIGLVNKVYPPDKLLDGAMEMARRLSKGAPLATRFALEAIDRGLEGPLRSGLKLEADLFSVLCATKDMREGTQAFIEKRKPQFQGA